MKIESINPDVRQPLASSSAARSRPSRLVSRWKHVLRVASDEVAGRKEVGDDEPLAVT